MQEHPIHTLERYWNFTSFRPLQEAIIQAVLNNDDVFVLLPTAGGKSICYQIPALMREGICIVISPLVALMNDQVNALKEKGIKAMALTSGLKKSDVDTMLDNCIYGNYKFLYLSPERLQQDIVQARIKQMNVNLIAVDEAHCISQWGNDFRPAYKNIALLRTLLPHTNIIALTATATNRVVESVIKDLDLLQPKVFKQSFARPNISFKVISAEDKYHQLERILKKHDDSSIIYVRSRNATLEIASFLKNKGFSTSFFHGGLTSEEKLKKLQQWLDDQIKIMVATNAFGMGIDKSNVSSVIHLNLPESIESYYQEAGRAGRNGKPSEAIIIKNNQDESQIKQQFLNALPTLDGTKTVYRKLCNYFQVPYGEGVDASFDFNFFDFYKTYNFNSLKTYNILQLLDRTSIIDLSQEFKKRSAVQFIISNNHLFNYLETNTKAAIVVKSLLRTYGGLFDQEVKVNLDLVASKSGISQAQIVKILEQLEFDSIITLRLHKTDSKITFLQPREDDKTIYRIAKTIEQQHELKSHHIASMLNYVNNNNICKSTQLLAYFEEKATKDCGICSVCLKNLKQSIKVSDSILEDILNILTLGEQTSRVLEMELNIETSLIKEALTMLLERNKIKVTTRNTYTIK
jgi:ATP-dependent DNA helicase RecQ